jgi:hypothetical protein
MLALAITGTRARVYPSDTEHVGVWFILVHLDFGPCISLA